LMRIQRRQILSPRQFESKKQIRTHFDFIMMLQA
jgi:hypothetical protein